MGVRAVVAVPMQGQAAIPAATLADPVDACKAAAMQATWVAPIVPAAQIAAAAIIAVAGTAGPAGTLHAVRP